ncbi:MAG: YbbR-like domain-containing protein [Breznakibacter sp.]
MFAKSFGILKKWYSAIGLYLWKDKKLVLFIFFLLISMGFWFLNALRKTYTTQINYDLEYFNLPGNELIAANVPKSVTLKVRGTGFTLLRYNLGRTFYPMPLNVGRMNKISDGSRRGAYINSKELLLIFASQLSNDLDLIEVKPDTIFVEYLRKNTLKVPLKFNGRTSFKQPSYQSGAIVLFPDSVTVSGPRSIVDTIKSISSKFTEFNDVSDTIRQMVDLEIPNEIETNFDKVKILVPSEAFTESAVDVPLMVKGSPLGTTVKTFPAEIKVSFRVALSRFEKIGSDQFFAVVDLNEIDPQTQTKLKVKLEKVPDYIYSVDYNPLFVAYLIEKQSFSPK